MTGRGTQRRVCGYVAPAPRRQLGAVYGQLSKTSQTLIPSRSTCEPGRRCMDCSLACLIAVATIRKSSQLRTVVVSMSCVVKFAAMSMTGLDRPSKRRKTEFERTFSATGQESEEAAAARAQFQGVRPLGRPTRKRSAPVCHGLRPRSLVGLRPHWSCQLFHPRVAGV